MDLSTLDTATARLGVPAFPCASDLVSGRPNLAAPAGIAGYAKQFMVGGVVDGHVQDATGRFWDRVGPPTG